MHGVHNGAERRCSRIPKIVQETRKRSSPGWWAARPCALLEPAPADAFESRRPCHGATLKRLHLGHGQVRSSIACYATPCQALAQPRATLTGSCTIFAGYKRSSITSPTSRARASTGYQGVRRMLRSARARATCACRAVLGSRNRARPHLLREGIAIARVPASASRCNAQLS